MKYICQLLFLKTTHRAKPTSYSVIKLYMGNTGGKSMGIELTASGINDVMISPITKFIKNSALAFWTLSESS